MLVIVALTATGSAGCGSQKPAPKRDAAAPVTTIPPPARTTPTTTTPATQVDEFAVAEGSPAADGDILVVYRGTTDGPDWTSYSLRSGETLRQGDDSDFQYSCGVGIVPRADGVHIVVTVDDVNTPAQGVKAGSDEYLLVGTDASSGDQLWKTAISKRSSDDTDTGSPCADSHSDSGYLDLADVLQISPSDGSMLFPSADGNLLVDLTSGRIGNLGGGSSVLAGSVIAVARDGDNGASVATFDAESGTPKGKASAALAACARRTSYGGCPVIATKRGAVFITDFGNTPEDDALVGATTSGRVLWRIPDEPGTGGAAETELDAAGAVVAEPEVAYPATGVSAVNAATGRSAWSFPDADYCGYTNGKVFLIDNQQLATLSAATGKQLSYDDQQSECPTVIDGALVEKSDSGPVVVPQPAG